MAGATQESPSYRKGERTKKQKKTQTKKDKNTEINRTQKKQRSSTKNKKEVACSCVVRSQGIDLHTRAKVSPITIIIISWARCGSRDGYF